MDSKLSGIVIIGVFGLFVGLVTMPQGNSAIPPTNAFSKIISGGQNITASSYDSNLTISTQGSITTSLAPNTITIKLIQKQCPAGQWFNGVAANGTLICG